jgi:hypothetical protein
VRSTDVKVEQPMEPMQAAFGVTFLGLPRGASG